MTTARRNAPIDLLVELGVRLSDCSDCFGWEYELIEVTDCGVVVREWHNTTCPQLGEMLADNAISDVEAGIR